MTVKKIECHDIDQHVKATADYLPGGEIFAAKNILDTNMRNFLVGLNRENVRVEEFLKTLQEQFIPDNTENFLEDWERVLGIGANGDCFSTDGTIEERQRNVLVKLASLGVQTASDFEELALLFGVVATVRSGTDIVSFPLTFPVTFLDVPRFTMIVEFVSTLGFPYTFPLQFGTDIIVTLECLFNQLKPANCDVVFIQV